MIFRQSAPNVLLVIFISFVSYCVFHYTAISQEMEQAALSQEEAMMLEEITDNPLNQAMEPTIDTASIDRNTEIQTTIRPQFTGTNFESLPWKNSVMFSSNELQNIYTNLNYRVTGQRNLIETVIPETDTSTQQQVEQVPAVAPAFYLNSILYYNPNNWTIWVNHRRIRKNTQLRDLQVGKITKDYVEFIWKPTNLNIISPDWISNMKPIGEIYPEKELTQEEISQIESKLETMNDNTDAESQEVFFGPEQPEELSPELANLEVFEEIKPTAESEAREDSSELAEEGTGEEIETKEHAREKDLILPPLYSQEKVSLDLTKLTNLLEEEQEEIDTRKRAEEVIRLAREAEKKAGYDSGASSVEVYDAFADKEIPFLWEYMSEDGNILVDTINGIVKFRVGINQTFVSRNMTIAEGRVQSTMIASGSQQTNELRTPDLERTIFEYQGNVVPGQ